MYALHNFGWTPKKWAQLEYRERVLVMASIRYQQEQEEAAQKKAEREAKSKSHRH